MDNTQHKRVSRRSKRIKALIARDGTTCWYCGLEMEGDVTVEHLLPRSAGGGNSSCNLVLAHHRCNTMADSLPLALKLALREHMRHGGLPGIASLLFS